jgi:hypothetical protein
MKKLKQDSDRIFPLFGRTTACWAVIWWLVLTLILVWLSPGRAAASQSAEKSANPRSALHSESLSTADPQPLSFAQVTWNIVLLPNPSPDTLLYSLNAVTAIAPNDVWIVGSANDNGGNFLTSALTIHWDGSQWSIKPCLGKFPDLRAVSAVSSSDVWAVGGFSTYHWDGTNWTEIPNSTLVLTTYGSFNSVKAISTDNVWAVGASQKPTGEELTYIEHWNGKQWSIVPSPNPNSSGREPNSTELNNLTSVAATSADDAWAVGYYRKSDGQYQSLTLHWDGVRWSMIPTPDLPDHNYLTAVAAISSDDVWAVGNLTTDMSHGPIGGLGPALVMHWNGMRWRIIQSPASTLRTTLSSVAASSTNDVWIVGTNYDNLGPKSLTMRWDGRQWNVVPSPNPSPNANYLSGVAVAPSGDVWAVGYAPMPGPQSALALHTSYIPGLPRTGGRGGDPSAGELVSLVAATLAALAVAVGVLLRCMFRRNQALSV